MTPLFGPFSLEDSLKKEHTVPFQLLLTEETPGIREVNKKQRILWEWRSFWPTSNRSIPLNLIHFNLSSLADFQNITIQDTYVSIKNRPLNLKIRKEKLVYKPLVEEYEKILAFGYKKKIKFPLAWIDMQGLFPRLEYYQHPLSSSYDLVLHLCKSGYQADLFKIEKNAYRYKITADLQLELSQMTFGHHLWHSLCLEGFNLNQIKKCANLIVLCPGQLMGYAEFLNRYL